MINDIQKELEEMDSIMRMYVQFLFISKICLNFIWILIIKAAD